MTTSIDLIEEIDLTTKKIWFIDNEDQFLSDLEAELEEVNLIDNSYITKDFREVLAACQRNEIDILVSDFKMPTKDGITLMEEIRKHNKAILLILYTGYSLSEGSEPAQRCSTANIRRLHKFDGLYSLLANMLNYLKEPRTDRSSEPSITDTKILLPYESEVAAEVSTDSDDQAIMLKGAVLNMAEDLLNELSILENKDVFIHTSGGKMTILELKTHIEKLTPVGMNYLLNWFKAEKLLRKYKGSK